MMSKKPHWRRGVVIKRGNEPERPARKDDHDRFVDLANSEPNKDRKQQYLLGAQIARFLGRWNEANNFHKHTGRPKGATCEAKYWSTLAAMATISANTGVTDGRALAKEAVKAGHWPKEVQPESAVKQAAILWNRKHSGK